MKLNIGLIGTGNMGSALAGAIAKDPEVSFLLANRRPEKAEALQAQIGGRVCTNEEAAREADILLLGVKPEKVAPVLEGLLPVLKTREERPLLVSMAGSVSLAELQEASERLLPAVRILPNIPVAVGEGVTFYVCGDDVTEEQKNRFLHMMRFSGRLIELEERLFDAGSAVAGCGGAFAAPFLEGLADGAVACGLPRTLAYELAEQMVLGTAKYLLETGQIPAQLKDAVCSPGGTSIRGVRAAEANGLRSAAMEAVIAAAGGLD